MYGRLIEHVDRGEPRVALQPPPQFDDVGQQVRLGELVGDRTDGNAVHLHDAVDASAAHCRPPGDDEHPPTGPLVTRSQLVCPVPAERRVELVRRPSGVGQGQDAFDRLVWREVARPEVDHAARISERVTDPATDTDTDCPGSGGDLGRDLERAGPIVRAHQPVPHPRAFIGANVPET